MAWSEEAIEEMKRLAKDGLSASQIAKGLSPFGLFSRNAVIGKMDRLGLVLGGRAPSAPVLRAPEVKPMGPNPLGNITRASFAQPVPMTLPGPLGDPARHAKVDAIALAPKALLDPAFAGCRWPLYRAAPDGSTLFCCNVREVAPYCEGHRRFAFSKTQPKADQEAEKALTRANRQVNAGSLVGGVVFGARVA